MLPDTAFGWASQLAMVGWLLLVVGLLLHGVDRRAVRAKQISTWALWAGGRLVPVVLGAGYAWAILKWFGSSSGGFESLAGVARLFESSGLLLAGWVHFLAFDLWVGRWQVDRLSEEMGADTGSTAPWIMRLTLLPCLLMTFLFGPIGLLLFLLLLTVRRLAVRRPSVSV